MQITVLLENTSMRPDVGAEHGLSLWIETDRYRILFDMGQGTLFAENAKTLGIDLATADLAVLSHGHYDHGGGLETFLACNAAAPVYVSRCAFEPHYNGASKYIGLPPHLEGHPRLVQTDGETKIGAGLTLHHCVGREKRHDLGSFGLTMRQGNALLPDDFRHEQHLLIEENGLRVLCSGCSHSGILDIVDWFRPDVLIGGFHFSKLPVDETLVGYAEQLDRYPTVFYTGHCTGSEQFACMKTRMRRLYGLSCGQTISIDAKSHKEECI